MPLAPTSRASARVMPSSAALEAAYTDWPALPRRATAEDTCTMRPHRSRSMDRSAAREHRKLPRAFVSMVRSHSSEGNFTASPSRETPAQLTRPTTNPRSEPTCRNASATDDSSSTSSRTTMPLAPASSTASRVEAASASLPRYPTATVQPPSPSATAQARPVQRDRDGGGGGVPDVLDVQHGPVQAETQPFGHRLDDPGVRLVGDQQVHLVGGDAGLVQELPARVGH